MQRVKCIVAYDGTNFSGYQVQPNKRTVQLEIEKVLARMHKSEAIRISASGRTDSTVHAVGQVFHFDTQLTLLPEQWKKALNSLLPDDITVQSVELVKNNFHSRFDVVRKEYRYKLLNTVGRDVFSRNYVYHYPYKLDYEAIKMGMMFLVGTHDFTSFSSAKTDVEDKVRTIFEAELLIENENIIFRFVGNGFLYNMVRILVGTLIDVGNGKTNPEEITKILEAKDRSHAGKTAPGHGLYLWKVDYE